MTSLEHLFNNFTTLTHNFLAFTVDYHNRELYYLMSVAFWVGAVTCGFKIDNCNKK